MENRVDNTSGIARPPTGWERFCDVFFRSLSYAFAWLTVALVVFIVYEIAVPARPALQKYGLGFIWSKTWDQGKDVYGILPQIWGTIYSSVLALIMGSIMGISVAIFLSERFLSTAVFQLLKLFGLQFHPFWKRLPEGLDGLMKNLVELLAAIPSVVYGLWGVVVVIPMIDPWCDWLHENFKAIPFFSTDMGATGGMLPAAIVLAVMIVPTVSAIARDALVSVPPKLREAAYGLGATRWEALFSVILPTAKIGIVGAILLAFGRALGETMALAMLAGGPGPISTSLFSPAETLAALLASKFPEAGSNVDLIGALMYAALVLLAITLIVNLLGAWILQASSQDRKGGR